MTTQSSVENIMPKSDSHSVIAVDFIKEFIKEFIYGRNSYFSLERFLQTDSYVDMLGWALSV